MSKTIKATELIPDASNANKGTQRGRAALEASLRQYGAGRSILVDRNGRVIAGNKTLETGVDIGLDDVIVVQTDGRQIVAVQRMDLDLAADDDQRARMLAYADNRVAELDLDFDATQLLADLNAGYDLTQLWQQDELDELLAGLLEDDEEMDDGGAGESQEEARASLADRFLVPPFSVLDARQGYWQERKRAWIALGIQSELGRGDNALDMSATMAGITDPDERAAWNTQRRESPRHSNGGGVRMALHNDPMQRKVQYDG